MPKKKAQKKRANGEGSVYKSGSKWIAQVDLGVISGKRKRKRKTAVTQKQARELLAEMQGESIHVLASDRVTVSQFLDNWIKTQVEPSASLNTIKSYRQRRRLYIDPHIGAVKLQKLSPMHISKMLASITGDASRVAAYQFLLYALKSAVKMQVIAKNPCIGVDRPKSRRKTIRPFTVEEVKTILDSCPDNRYRHIYTLCFHCGLRASEACGLMWKDIDLKEKTAHIQRQTITKKGGHVLDRVKSQHSNRVVHLTGQAIYELQEQRKRMMKLGHASSPIVTLNARGKIMSCNTVGNAWTRVLKEAGIEHRGIHHARHTFATLSLMAGVPIQVVSKSLGHSEVSITANKYAHLYENSLAEAAQKISELLG